MINRTSIAGTVNHLLKLLPGHITVWHRGAILYATEPNPSNSLNHWPIVQAAREQHEAILISAPRQHQLCQECPRCSDCSLALELFIPFRLNQQMSGGICYQFTATAANLLQTNLNAWLEHLKDYTRHIELLIEDATKRHRELLKTQQLTYLLNLVPEGVVLLDEHANITAYNEMANLHELTSLLQPLKHHNPASELPATLSLPNSAGEIQLKGKSFYYNKRFIGALYHTQKSAPLLKEKAKPSKQTIMPSIIGNNPAIQKILDIIKQVARSDSTILLRGESGTGKELFAQAIHELSPRAHKPFVAINCAAIPEHLLESELFGYEEGSFTGAKKGGKPGKIELANHGTLFLDEVGDMPLALQAKLLRVIQEKSIERVGGSHPIPINVRLVAATHRNLEEMIGQGTFREDLFFRLSVIPIFIPPLRQRPEDIELLLNYFLRKYCISLRKPFKIFSYGSLQRLMSYSWPGNIRELENMVEYLVNIHAQDVINAEDLPLNISRSSPAEEAPPTMRTMPLAAKPGHGSRSQRSRDELIELLNRYGWDTAGKRETAAALGISLATLYRRLHKYKIKES